MNEAMIHRHLSLAADGCQSGNLTNLQPGQFDIFRVDVEADELPNAAEFRRLCSVSQPEKRIKHDCLGCVTLDFDAIDRKLDRKRSRMRPLNLPAPYGFIWDKPDVAPAPNITSFGVSPTPDV